MPKKSRRSGRAARQPSRSGATAPSSSDSPPAASAEHRTVQELNGRLQTNQELLQAFVADNNSIGVRTLIVDFFFSFANAAVPEFLAKRAIVMREVIKAEVDFYAKTKSLQEYVDMASEHGCVVMLAVLDSLRSDDEQEFYSSEPVTTVSDDSTELWPYEKRFDMLQVYHAYANYLRSFQMDEGAMICAEAMISLPYNHIGELRACAVLGAFLLLSEDQSCRTLSFSCHGDHLRRVLKFISQDKKEHPVTRILALLSRATDQSASSSSVANYSRRILFIAKSELEAIVQYPTVINVVHSDRGTYNISPCSLGPYESFPASSLSSKLRAVFDCAPEIFRRSNLFALINNGASRHLERIEGPPRNVTFGSVDPLQYVLSVGGGYCDGCGKTPEEAGLSALFKCEQCRLAHYCSPECQSRCWSEGHADCCKKFGRFEVDDKVILQNLKNAAELDGQMAIIKSRASSGRWVILLAHPTHVKRGPLSVKPENIRHPRPVK